MLLARILWFYNNFKWSDLIPPGGTFISALAQRLEARLGNKFKANTVLAIKLARAVYFMLRNHTVFDPERMVAALTHT